MKLIRHTFQADCTLGTLLDSAMNDRFVAVTIERPWLDNKPRVSCIPEGIYDVVPYDSPTKGTVFLLKNVPHRDMIEIHSANLASELLGCIAPGLKAGKLQGKEAVLYSKEAMKKITDLVNNKPFKLEIVKI